MDTTHGETSTEQLPSIRKSELYWGGFWFSEQWFGELLFYRCENCSALIKPHDLDLIHHAEYHTSRR